MRLFYTCVLFLLDRFFEKPFHGRFIYSQKFLPEMCLYAWPGTLDLNPTTPPTGLRWLQVRHLQNKIWKNISSVTSPQRISGKISESNKIVLKKVLKNLSLLNTAWVWWEAKDCNNQLNKLCQQQWHEMSRGSWIKFIQTSHIVTH